MNIGNPIKAIPRYANLALSGIQGKPSPIPYLNTPGSGMADNAIYNTTLYAHNNPVQAIGANVGGWAVNNMLGNPIGAAIDTATFGLTDFKRDDVEPIPDSMAIMYPPSVTSVAPGTKDLRYINGNQRFMVTKQNYPEAFQTYSLPPLDAAERKKQMEYLQRKVATDLITIQALQTQPGMEQQY